MILINFAGAHRRLPADVFPQPEFRSTTLLRGRMPGAESERQFGRRTIGETVPHMRGALQPPERKSEPQHHRRGHQQEIAHVQTPLPV